MRTITDLIGTESARAGQEALTRGDALARSAAVQLVRFSPSLVTSEVDDGAACVEFRVVDGALRWHCSCPEGRVGLFCAHCVATARSVRARTDRKDPPDASVSTTRIAS